MCEYFGIEFNCGSIWMTMKKDQNILADLKELL